MKGKPAISNTLRLKCIRSATCLLVCLGACTPWFAARAQAPSPSAPAQAQAPAGAGAQIDELIKQCNEQMNVKGEFQRAAELAEQALDLSEKAGDKVRASSAMVYLASAYAYQGRLAEAVEIARKNVSLARGTGDKKVLEQALNTAAGATGESGQYEECLSYLYETLGLAREIGDSTMQYMSLLNIGEAYVRTGDPDRAEAPLRESLRLAHRLTQSDGVIDRYSKKGTEMSLLNLGAMEGARQNYRAALNYYEQVYASHPQSPLWVIAALEGMAEAHEQLGDPQKAIGLLEQAIALSEKASTGLQYSRLVSHLGLNEERLGHFEDALGSQNRALALIHQNGGNPDSEWQIEGRIGHVDRALGRNRDALEHYRNSIDGIERLRSVAINTEEGRAGVLAISRAVYAETADLLVAMDHDSDAFEIAERGRARGFLDMLAMSRSGLEDQLTPDQKIRETALLSRITEVQKEAWKERISAKEEQQHKAELRAAEEDLDAFHTEVRRANPRYASIRYPEPVDVGRVQSDLLDANTTLVEFLLGERRSLAWVVSKDRLSVSVLPRAKAIETQLAGFRNALKRRASALTEQSSLEEIERAGSKLYASLFQPIEKYIPGGSTLVIVPDGPLAYLPFETLIAGTRHEPAGVRPVYLMERFPILYAPSASALEELKSLNPPRSGWPRMLLAFGDPIADTKSASPDRTSETDARSVSSLPPVTPPLDQAEKERPNPNSETSPNSSAYRERGFSLARLPYTREEVLGIGRLYPPSQRQIFLAEDATEERLKTVRLDQYRYIHFASHGFIDENIPERSGILFTTETGSKEPGILQVSEIMRLKLSADLVTLSACSTGLGRLVNGEGILGLTRAFFYAGARNVTVSLWNVNDSATAALMKAFYENLNRGLPKGEALREAKLGMLQSQNTAWHHPYFWAAFVLVGPGN